MYHPTMRTAALTLGFLVALVARADLAPPTPPRIPEGIADARGQLGFFRGRDAGIAAVDLSTGEIRWTSSEGEWLLHADLNTVAVAAIDPKSAGALRIRFLRPLQLGQGAEYAPVIAMGGRFVALSEQKDRHERVLLHDLANKATTPIAELPPFGRLCQPPFAILGDRMLCVREGEGEPIDGGI